MNKRTRMRALLITSLIPFILVACSNASSESTTRSYNDPDAISKYNLNVVNNKNIFINNVDGYSLQVDKDMKVDMSYSSVCTVLENNDKRIEIFKQPLSGISIARYIDYSNKFIENTADHKVEYNGDQTISGRQVHVLSWNREKLSRVKNDKNYYLVLDIAEKDFVYTIFVKANNPIGNLAEYEYLLNDFNTFQPTEASFTYKSLPVNLGTKNWNQETRDFYMKFFSVDAPLTWGIFEPNTDMLDYEPLNSLEKYTNYSFPIILNYSDFENSFEYPNLKLRLDTAYNNGKTMELTLQTNWKAKGKGNMVYDVLSGKYDRFLKDYALTIKDFGYPVIFRLGNEMNGDWCPYAGYNTSRDPMVFKEFYRYIYSIFKEAGVDNTIWVWNPNVESFPNFKWNDTLMYYPGDEFVDVVGLTAYNTGTYYASTGEEWQEFDELYGNLYNDYCKNFGQPLMICEFASASHGGDKTQWVSNMFENMKNYSKIKVAIWWDGRDKDTDGNIARSYYIDDPVSVLDVFKKHLSPL